MRRVGKSWTSVFFFFLRLWNCDSVCSHYGCTQIPLWVSLSKFLSFTPSICEFPDSFFFFFYSAVQTRALQHCHTPHWLPWRNSPPGLQGTQVYCLWLLYLDENMICWKGSTCFLLLFFRLHPPHKHQRGVAWCALFHPSPFQEFDYAHVCVKLVWCFVAINFSVSACQRPRRGAV